jgi:hypothetical protein
VATTRPDTGGMDDVAASYDKIRANIERVIARPTWSASPWWPCWPRDTS